MKHVRIWCDELSRHGAIVDVVVGPSAEDAEFIPRAKPPQKLTALIDTGARGTYIKQGVVDHYGLTPTDFRYVRTLRDGPAEKHPVYVMYFAVVDEAGTPVFEDEIALIGGLLDSAEYDVLLGRDVLAEATFVYCGTRQRFCLRFH